jgi:hypothetical protein
MRLGPAITAAVLASAISATLAADFVMRPGRWEVTAQMQFPEELPAGFPLAGPITSVTCITPEEAEQMRNMQWLLPTDSCSASVEEPSAGEIQLHAVCSEDGEDVVIDYRVRMHSPDHWSGVSTSHAADPTQRLTMTVEGKRTGNACTAAELAEDAEE